MDNQAETLIEPEEVPGVKAALLRYRVMAWVVGSLLVPLVIGWLLGLVGLPNGLTKLLGVPHGWLYMVLLITAYDLSRRVGWSIKWVLAIMAAGTIPFLSFVAEHYATRDVKRQLAAVC